MKKEDILKENNMDLLCKLGSQFLRRLERIGVESVLVSDAELQRVVRDMIKDHQADMELQKERIKEQKKYGKKGKITDNK